MRALEGWRVGDFVRKLWAVPAIKENVEAAEVAPGGGLVLTCTNVAAAAEFVACGVSVAGRHLEISPATGPTRVITVRGIPLEMEGVLLAPGLTEYGTIVGSIDHKRWDGTHLKTGERVVRIALKKAIPQRIALNVGGRRIIAYIRYVGQPQVCWQCNNEGHTKRECPENLCRRGSHGHRGGRGLSAGRGNAVLDDLRPTTARHTRALRPPQPPGGNHGLAARPGDGHGAAIAVAHHPRERRPPIL